MRSTPLELAPLVRARNRASLSVGVGIVAGFAVGAVLSPASMWLAGAIWAAVFSLCTGAVLILMQRYVNLFNTGQRVEGRVCEERMTAAGRGVTIQFEDARGVSRLAWAFPSRLRVGRRTTVIVGPAGSRLVLPHNGCRFVRATALTEARLLQVVGERVVG